VEDERPMVVPLPPALLDWDGAARYLHITRRHMRDLAARGEVASIRVGRLVRFRPADLDDYIAAQVREARA
jgi:excisionase family DNA binding protein